MPFKKRDGSDPKADLKKYPSDVVRRKQKALSTIGVLLEAETKRLLLTPGRGRLRNADRIGAGSYRRVKGVLKRVVRGVARTNIDLTDRASAPGDPPAPDTLQLYRSVTHEVRANSVAVGTNSEYAEPLERGTVTAGRGRRTVILPRPFLRPAVDGTRAQVREIVRSAFGGGPGRA